MLQPLGHTQNFADRLGQAVPLGFFFAETFLAGSSETIDPRSPIVLGDPPFGGDPARLLHTVKRWVERPFLDAECVISDLLNARGHAVPVPWLTAEGLQHKKIESPLERVRLLRLWQHT